MRHGLKERFAKQGEYVLRRIGIKEGQTVLDFGCGSGNYTIPIAKIVGTEGIVYALDKNMYSLNELMQRARTEGLTNIKRIDTSGEVKIDLDDESVDAVLLYDIFWYFTLASFANSLMSSTTSILFFSFTSTLNPIASYLCTYIY